MLTQSMMLKTIKPSPMFQKRHYDWLAKFMAGNRPLPRDGVRYVQWTATVEDLINRLEDEAEQSGINFKPALFWSACNA